MARSTDLTNLNLATLNLTTAGSESVGTSGILTVSTDLTTITSVVASLGVEPSSDAGAAAYAIGIASGSNVILKAYQDDFVTLATVATTVNWIATGTV